MAKSIIHQMKEVGANEARVHLSRLLREVEQGETIFLTRRGKPVAKLEAIPPRDAGETIAAIREFRKGRTLDGLSIKDLINEGRRF